MITDPEVLLFPSSDLLILSEVSSPVCLRYFPVSNDISWLLVKDRHTIKKRQDISSEEGFHLSLNLTLLGSFFGN